VTRSTSPGAETSDPPTPADPPWPADQIERWPVARLVPYARNARKHTAKQVAEIAASIREWGWTIPVLIDDAGRIIAGHGRVLAARQLAIIDIPAIVARGWTEAQKRAYGLADNQIALNASWDLTMLRVELADLRDQAVDLALLGFAASDAIPREDAGTSLPAAVQLAPAREYAVVMCADADEWERLKVALNLTPVRRGGYKPGSPFDDIGTQRVVTAAAVLGLIETAAVGHTGAAGRANAPRRAAPVPAPANGRQRAKKKPANEGRAKVGRTAEVTA
jgi:hypothetical protein